VNPDSIQVGWKLRIPNQDMANALHGQNAPQGLDKEALSNATYTGVMTSDDSYALQDRKFTEPAAPGTPLLTKVMLTDQIAYGDLNGAPFRLTKEQKPMIEYLTLTYVAPFLIRVVITLVLVLIGIQLMRWGLKVLQRTLERAQLDAIAIRFVTVLARIGALMLIGIVALGALGVDTTGMIAVLGGLTIALGLALQGTIKHFASGILLVIFHPFRSGDYVQAAGMEGVVEHIDLYSTTLRTADNKEVIVPNANVADNTIINFASRPVRRIDMVVSIGYGEDVQRARQLILEALALDARILAEPAPEVALDQLTDASVSFVVRPWVKREDYPKVKTEFLERIKASFQANGISNPLPQLRVHLDAAAQLQA